MRECDSFSLLWLSKVMSIVNEVFSTLVVFASVAIPLRTRISSYRLSTLMQFSLPASSHPSPWRIQTTHESHFTLNTYIFGICYTPSLLLYANKCLRIKFARYISMRAWLHLRNWLIGIPNLPETVVTSLSGISLQLSPVSYPCLLLVTMKLLLYYLNDFLYMK